MSQAHNKIGLFELTVITSINIMGAGIIMLPANLAQVGSISILSWLVTAIGSIVIAYIFAKAGMYTRKKGGMVGYAQYAFGESGAFMTTYTFTIAIILANCGIALSVVGYASNFLHVELTPMGTALCTVAVIWLSAIPSFLGPKFTGKVSDITIWGVLIPLIGMCILGWFFFDKNMFIQAWNPHHYSLFDGVSRSISVTLYAFLGFESAAANAEVSENPERDIPRAVMISTLITAVIYILSTSAMQGIVPNAELAASNAPFGLAYQYMFGPTVSTIINLFLTISCFGSLLAWQFTISNQIRTSAMERFFPKCLESVTRHCAAYKALAVICIVETVLIMMTASPTLSEQFTVLINMSVVTNVIPYLYTMAAVLTMARIRKVGKSMITRLDALVFLGGVYVIYAIYSSGEIPIIVGSLATFFGIILFGYVYPGLGQEEFIKVEELNKTLGSKNLMDNGD